MHASADDSYLKTPSLELRVTVMFLSCLFVIFVGAFRIESNIEYALSSAIFLPILLVAWLNGRACALIIAGMAMLAWVGSDIFAHRQFGEAWIPYVNGTIRLISYSFAAIVVSRLHQLLKNERKLSSQDCLTELLSRRAFIDAGAIEVERARRYGHSLAVAFIDLDNFKTINDTRGHAAGDTVLRLTARALRTSLRETDLVARFGGDEFAIVLPETDLAAATEASRKISITLKKMLAEFPSVSASIGIASFQRADFSFGEMLNAADELMYEIKKSGKNGVRIRQVMGKNPETEAWLPGIGELPRQARTVADIHRIT